MPRAVYDGKHAKLRRQRGLEAVFAVEFRGEFLGRFVAEGIADDDISSPVLAFVQPGPHVAVVEAVLVRNLLDLPLAEQGSRACGSMNLPQASAKLGRYQLT